MNEAALRERLLKARDKAIADRNNKKQQSLQLTEILRILQEDTLPTLNRMSTDLRLGFRLDLDDRSIHFSSELAFGELAYISEGDVAVLKYARTNDPYWIVIYLSGNNYNEALLDAVCSALEAKDLLQSTLPTQEDSVVDLKEMAEFIKLDGLSLCDDAERRMVGFSRVQDGVTITKRMHLTDLGDNLESRAIQELRLKLQSQGS